MSNFHKLFSAALSMAEIFPTTHPLEWIARVYAEGTFIQSEGKI